MGCNYAKTRSERAGFVSHTYKTSSIGRAIPNELSSTKKKKRGREAGWSQAAYESIMVTETYGFASLQISLRGRACELSAPGSNVISVSGSAGRSSYVCSYPLWTDRLSATGDHLSLDSRLNSELAFKMDGNHRFPTHQTRKK